MFAAESCQVARSSCSRLGVVVGGWIGIGTEVEQEWRCYVVLCCADRDDFVIGGGRLMCGSKRTSKMGDLGFL